MDRELSRKSPLTVRTANLRGLQTGWVAEGPTEPSPTATANAAVPILLLLHGYPDTPESWLPQIEHFRRRFRVIAPFIRGARPSEAADRLNRYSLESSSLDYLEILKIEDPTEARRVFVVGHDIGGVQAWHLASLLGERLGALAIINSLPLPLMAQRLSSQPAQVARSWYIYPMLIPKLADPILRRFPGKLLQAAHRIGGLKPDKQPRLAKALPGIVNPVNHYRAFFKALPVALRQLPRKLTCPVLVIWGKDEPCLTRLRQDELAAFAHSVVIRVLRGSHWLHREDPEAVNQMLEEFLC